MPGKRVQLDDATWHALNMLARDRMMNFQELADEAFRDFFETHGRPTDLTAALRQSAGKTATVHQLAAPKRGSRPSGNDKKRSRSLAPPLSSFRRAGLWPARPESITQGSAISNGPVVMDSGPRASARPE